MPTLDVSDIPVCAEFSDRFDVLSRPEAISDLGRSTSSQVMATAYGTIYPSGDNSLVRQTDYDANRKTITVVTPYRLRQASPGYKPDLILYRGSEYIVSSVQDYSQFGAGFVVAEASSIQALDPPPQ